METIRYPESDAEAIDKALAKHEDRKAALQIQRDILHSSKNSIFAGQSNGGEDSSSESSSDEDDDKNVEVRDTFLVGQTSCCLCCISFYVGNNAILSNFYTSYKTIVDLFAVPT